MTFAQIIRKSCHDSLELFVELGSRNIMQMIRKEDGTFAMMVNEAELNKCSFELKQLVALAFAKDPASRMDIYLTGECLGKGPKVFRPTLEQMLALEQMELSIEARDFHTPFETMILELPEEYGKSPGMDQINVSVLHCRVIGDARYMVHSCICDTTSFKTWTGLDGSELVESWYAKMNDELFQKGELLMSDAEIERERQIRRAALNYCLLLDEVGIKQVGYGSPNEYAKLVKWCRKSNSHTLSNKRQLLAQPIIFDLKKPTQLVRVLGSANSPHEESGRVVSPHNRRGHYRMQPYGPGSSLRKRIRVPAVIVNSHLLFSQPLKSEYKT